MPTPRSTLTPVGSVPASPLAAGSDPQGGRFHLLAECSDWRACLEPGRTPPAMPAGPEARVLVDEEGKAPTRFEWDPTTGSLRVAHREAVARHPSPTLPRRPDERRGADRDRYGSWYWISDDARGIVRLPPGATDAHRWWSLDDLAATCTSGSTRGGEFAPVTAPVVADGSRLAGLAITSGHRLLAGLVDDQGGLMLFDLHGRGAPLVLRWPGDHTVTPFDLASTTDGGMLVLDRIRRTWWRLDRHVRLAADTTAGLSAAFEPANGSPPSCPPDLVIVPRGHALAATGPDAVVDPVAITEGPGVVLVLDRPPTGPSAIVLCDPATPSGVRARLPVSVEALDPARPDLPAFVHDVVGQDLAFGPAATTTPLPGPLVYVADARTSGTEAYALRLDPPALDHQADELPMRSWQAKAIVAVGGDVFYDAVGHWVPLEPFGNCNMERSATLRTPTSFLEDPVPGQPFDSRTPGCVWHRLLIDAAIPDGCAIAVGARATDDPAVLDRLPFLAQPTMYRRGGGSELPWHDPWADVSRPTSPRTGTWELLFQQISGRYLQLELSFAGTGRSTPSLRALRAWYPRFSYVGAYLPEVYQEEDEPHRFLERMLANMEGLLTDHEVRIEHAWMLADSRTAPAAALDWLASWVGLHLEPAWTNSRRRFLLQHVDRMYRARGTIGGLRALLRLYLGCSLDENVVFCPTARSDDPARIVDGVAPHRFRVLIPAELDTDRAAMVARIVEAARPAHASFEIRSWSGLLVVGEAQVGIDTLLGRSAHFEPIVLDATKIAAGVLGAAHPFDIADRIVSDRDRLGELPAL